MDPNVGVLNQLLRAFTAQSLLGISNLSLSAHTLLWSLGAIELIMAALWWAHSGGEALGKLVKKLLFLTVFVGIVGNYTSILGLLVASFTQIGVRAAGMNSDVILSPSGIVLQGLTVVKPLVDYLVDASGFKPGKIFFFAVTLLITMGAYAMLALQVLITRIEFGMMAALGLVFVPLAVFKPTAFLSEKIFGAMVAFGVKLMVLSFVIAVGFPVMQLIVLPLDPQAWQLMYAMIGSMALAALALHAPGVAAGLLAGSPTLTAGAAASGTALALGAAASPYLGLKAGSLVMGGASYAASPVTAAASDIARVSASKLGIKAEQLGFGESALKQGLHGAGSASGFPEINTASAGQRPFVGSGEGGTSGGAASVKNFQEFKDRSKESA